MMEFGSLAIRCKHCGQHSNWRFFGGTTHCLKNNDQHHEFESADEIIEALTTELTTLRAENATFRNAQKACEDCDGPTMEEVNKLRELVAAARKIRVNYADVLGSIWQEDDGTWELADGRTFATALEAFDALRGEGENK